MYFLSEVCRVAYGDLCFLRRHLPETIISAMVGPLLYLVAFAYGMRSGDTEAGVSYVAYAIPGIVAMTSMTAGFTSTAQKIIIQRLFHTSFDELILSPMHTSSIVFGKAVIGMLRGLIGSSILLILGLFLTPDLVLGIGTVVSLLLSCIMFSLLGVAAGLLAKSSVSLNVFTSLVIMPMTFLCGTIFSVSALPSIVGDIVWALPLTHSSEVIRASALGWDVPWISVAVMLAYLVAFYALDYCIIRKKLYRSLRGGIIQEMCLHLEVTWPAHHSSRQKSVSDFMMDGPPSVYEGYVCLNRFSLVILSDTMTAVVLCWLDPFNPNERRSSKGCMSYGILSV